MGKMLPGALMAGKVCTTVLFISLIALVLFPLVDDTVVSVIAAVDAVFLAISFVSYILAYFGKTQRFRTSKANRKKSVGCFRRTFLSKNTRRPFSEPPHNDNFLSPRDTACHGYAVGLSADISTASAFPTVSASVPKVYHTTGGDW